jgi:hypothetical protein
MQPETIERWKNLSERIEKESDLQKLAALVLEINALLEEELKRLKADSENKTR